MPTFIYVYIILQCGLCVHVSGGGEHPFYITFRSYKPGDAPVRVDNLCEDLFLKIHQQQLGQVLCSLCFELHFHEIFILHLSVCLGLY